MIARYARTSVLWTLAAACVLVPLPARANLIHTVLGIVAPEYVEYVTVIECIVDKGTIDEAVAKTCVEHYAKEQGKQLVASDPKLKSIVDTVLAAKAGQWVRVLELVGTDGLKTVVCSGAISVGGALKDFVCGSAFKLVAEHVIKPALQAVVNGDWWALVTLLGPQTACGVIPGGEAKDLLCGALAQALEEIGKITKGAVNTVADGLISLGETLSGQSQHMHPDKYYAMYWHPKIHIGVRVILNGGQSSYGSEYESCVGYFDSHKASKSTAEKWCGRMRDQLTAHVKAIVPAIKAAPDAYFQGTIKAQVPRLVIERYHSGPNDAGLLAQKYWHILEPYKTLSTACRAAIAAQVPIPGKPPTQYDSGPPYSAYGWACDRAMESTAQALAAYRSQGMVGLMAGLGNMGCKSHKQGADPKFYARCDSFEGYIDCKAKLTALQAKGAAHCLVDAGAAEPKLAVKIAAELGAKRCAVPGNVARTVECTRPWKQDLCIALAKKYEGWSGASGQGLGIICALKNDPAFLAEKGKAQGLLNTLNGVKQVGAVQKPGGKPEGLVMVPPGSKPCSLGQYDPLVIRCPGRPEVPAQMKVTLPGCAPDPNKDGADAVCFSGPLSAAQPVQAALTKPAAVLPSGPDLTAQPGPWLLRRGGHEVVQWGGNVAISDAAALSTQDGKCYFGLHFELVNAGSAPSGPFEFALAAQGERPTKRTSGALAPGTAGSHNVYAYLRPGANLLSLSIDSAQQVGEGNEGNNELSITVTVNGSCGGGSASARPAPERQAPIRAPVPSGVSRERPVQGR